MFYYRDEAGGCAVSQLILPGRTKVKEIVPEGVVCETDGTVFTVEADSVVCALGFRAPYDKVDALCALVDEYYIVGDCSQVGMIYHAIDQAYYAALRV